MCTRKKTFFLTKIMIFNKNLLIILVKVNVILKFSLSFVDIYLCRDNNVSWDGSRKNIKVADWLLSWDLQNRDHRGGHGGTCSDA